MIEVTGSLWAYKPDADVRVITTNGSVKGDGTAVMGAGCALEAAQQFPLLPKELGRVIRDRGNNVFVWAPDWFGTDYTLVTFPTKKEWHRNSDKYLIFKSACRLADLADRNKWRSIICPRFGAGMGKLSWEEDVKPSIEKILDDRFYIITHGNS